MTKVISHSMIGWMSGLHKQQEVVEQVRNAASLIDFARISR